MNTLDLIYTNISKAFKAVPNPHLGFSDHLVVMLIPAYKPLLIRGKTTVKKVRVWPGEATSALQDFFDCIDWATFKDTATANKHTNMEEYSATVSAFIKKCTEDICVIKNITTWANQKPWMKSEVYGMLKARNVAFKSVDVAALRSARANHAIRVAHAQKIQRFFHDPINIRQMWQEIQSITDYKAANYKAVMAAQTSSTN